MRAAEVGFVTAGGYRFAKTRAAARTLSNQLIGGEIFHMHAENHGVYGVRKMQRLLGRQGWATGRDQTGRTMRSLGPRCVKRGKQVFTTKSDPGGVRPTDLVLRRFPADAPRRLRVVDFCGLWTWPRSMLAGTSPDSPTTPTTGQRHGRGPQPRSHDRADPRPRAMAHRPASRTRNPGMGVVVEHPAVPFRARLPHPHRGQTHVSAETESLLDATVSQKKI